MCTVKKNNLNYISVRNNKNYIFQNKSLIWGKVSVEEHSRKLIKWFLFFQTVKISLSNISCFYFSIEKCLEKKFA